jgi:hypothetical protein
MKESLNIIKGENEMEKDFKTLNNIDDTTKFQLVSADDYFGWLSQGLVNLSPVYQRPYTYPDVSDNHWGSAWQKELISDYLNGAFIQPIHLLNRDKDENNYLYWIIDGGHRTKTLYNFFVLGLLKTPKGLNIEWNGNVYDIGNKTWKEIVSSNKELTGYLKELHFLIFEYNVTISKGRKIFLKLNDLHSMNDMEKLNAYEHILANTIRNLGDVTLSPFTMFNEFNENGKLVHINMRNIKRVTDELVLFLADYLNQGGYDKYKEPNASALRGWYELCEESKSSSNLWKVGSKKYNHLHNILSKLNDLVLNSDRPRGEWKKLTLFKAAILIDYFYSKNNYNWDSLNIDWNEFNKCIDLVMADVNKKQPAVVHNPKTRYHIVNNKVEVSVPGDDKESYTIDKVFTGGNRIDDIEFWLFHMITSKKEFGITKVQNRTFGKNKKLNNFTGKCEKCLKDITMSESRSDHILPHSLGGNTDSKKYDNHQILCSDCNVAKSSGMNKTDVTKIKELNDLTPEQIRKINEVLEMGA